ncbi:LOC110645823 isoform [Fagus crenata]
MDDSEKLTALKKAYAEIILNTAKEAAARIMVSEKKALRFQQELFSTKEEALRMLLRLKQMLDSKVTEAEMTSLSQQKKIEELEAQLQEAEDIVRDLREELREVQAELEKVTNNQLQLMDEQNLEGDTAIREEISQENRLMTCGSIFSIPDSQLEPVIASDMKNLTSNGTYEGNKCYSANDSHMDNCYLPNPYFASIVMRSKEPELYRNGCTQRIRAFEKYLLDGKLSFSGQVDDVKNEAFSKGDKEGKGLYKTSMHKADNMLGDEEKNQDELKVMQTDNGHIQVQAVKSFRRSRRKRASRFWKSKAPSCKQGNGICVVPTHEAENLGVEEKNLDELKVMQENKSDIQVQIVKSFCRKRKRAARCIKSKAPSCTSLVDQVMEIPQVSDLSNSKTSPDSVDNNEEAVEIPSKITENEGQKDSVSIVGPVVLSDATGTQLGSIDMTQNDAEFVNHCSVQNTMNNDTAPINKLDMTMQESLSAENSGVQCCRTDVETFDESLVNSDLKASDSNDVVSQTVNNRFLKYTFRRKRKKESLSSPDWDSSLDNGTLNRDTRKNQNGSLEPQNTLVTESSRDSRRLAQVARQLISLSEKKWWQ